MKRRIICLFLSLVFALSCLSSCSDAPSEPDINSEISVVATIFPQYDFARAVSGELANVKMLIKPAAEIHSFDPTPSDIIEIQNSDLFIYIGGEGDAWVDSILDSIDTDEIKILRLMDFVSPIEEEAVNSSSGEHDHNEAEIEFDEHIWTAPSNAIKMTEAIADALCEIDPQNSDAYKANCETYTSEIQGVADEIQEVVDSAKHKMLLVADRFPFIYFTKEFGLDYMAAFNGCSTETEVSAVVLAELIDYLEDNGLSAVYHVELSNENIATAVSEQTGAEKLLLHSCHNISSDDFNAGVTYVDLMRQNAANLRKGLN